MVTIALSLKPYHSFPLVMLQDHELDVNCLVDTARLYLQTNENMQRHEGVHSGDVFIFATTQGDIYHSISLLLPVAFLVRGLVTKSSRSTSPLPEDTGVE